MNDNQQIKELYDSEGGPEIRHGENTDTGISTREVLLATVLLLAVIVGVLR